MSEYTQLICRKCGGRLTAKAGGVHVCLNCGTEWKINDYATIEDGVKNGLLSALSDENEKKLANLRVNLWDEIGERIKDFKKIGDICDQMRAIDPADLYACFFSALSSGSRPKIKRFLRGLKKQISGNEKLLDVVFDNLLKEASSLDGESYDLIADAIEQAYFEKDASSFSKYNGKLERMRTDANVGFYAPETARDAFLCYAHTESDLAAVRNLIGYLEDEKGLKCFAAYRNLAKTFGHIHDYETAIKTAIDNSKVFVFVSSEKSRDLSRDSLKLECAYIDELDKKGIHKSRVEYCFESNYTVVTEADKRIKQIFSGLQRVFDESGVYQVIKDLNDKQILEKAAAEERAKVEAENRRKEAQAKDDEISRLKAELENAKKQEALRREAEQERIKREAEERAKKEAEERAKAEKKQNNEENGGIYQKIFSGAHGFLTTEELKLFEKAKNKSKQAPNSKEVAEWFEKGENYYYGKNGVSQNYSEAFKWFKKAAEQGHAISQYNLGFCYEEKLGVEQDYAESFKWYKKSAEQGYDDAQWKLGYCYEHGQGVEKNYVDAAKWYKKVAEKTDFLGRALAQYNLGYHYYNGIGVAKDYSEAFKWFKMAAENGDKSAQCYVGVCYEKGQGVVQNYSEAFKWYKKSAEKGNVFAQNNLGYCYYFGRGVDKNYTEAVKWYKQAAKNGNPNAIKRLKALGETY